MAIDRSDSMADAMKVGMIGTMDAAETHQCSLIFCALSNNTTTYHEVLVWCADYWSTNDDAWFSIQ